MKRGFSWAMEIEEGEIGLFEVIDMDAAAELGLDSGERKWEVERRLA